VFHLATGCEVSGIGPVCGRTSRRAVLEQVVVVVDGGWGCAVRRRLTGGRLIGCVVAESGRSTASGSLATRSSFHWKSIRSAGGGVPRRM
jgi:hypothetical protein